MEYFDKKKDVLDIQLTSYGKQLLSRGMFKPKYYTFSDDGIMYDQMWMSGTAKYDEPQSKREPRIQEETPRLKTQYRKVGAERAVHWLARGEAVGHPMVSTDGGWHLEAIKEDIFEMPSKEKFNNWDELKWSFVEAEKLLENSLGTKSYFNDYNPAWNLLFYNGEISNSTEYYEKKDIIAKIPQVNCTLTDIIWLMDSNAEPSDLISDVKNVNQLIANNRLSGRFGKNEELTEDELEAAETELHYLRGGAGPGELPQFPYTNDIYNEYFDTMPVVSSNPEDSIKMFLKKDFLFLSVEEANVDFSMENFTVEVYEVTTTDNSGLGEESLRQMFFSQGTYGSWFDLDDEYTSNSKHHNNVHSVFSIEVDEEIDSALACTLIGKDEKLKNKNIYISDIFDCQETLPESTYQDPYVNVPDVDSGDIC